MRGYVLWFTGRPASGKTTLAQVACHWLSAADIPHLWLDSDGMRQAFYTASDYSERGRNRFYAGLSYVAEQAVEGGTVVVISATASKAQYRNDLRAMNLPLDEVWVRASNQILKERDNKGLYAAAERGQTKTLPGVNVPYEAPRAPGLTIDTGTHDVEQCRISLEDWLRGNPELTRLSVSNSNA